MVWTKMHTQTPSIRPKYSISFLFFFSLVPSCPFLHTLLSLCNWLYTLVSWSRPKQCYAIIPSVTALQAHKYKDTLFGSLPGSLPCLIPIILPSYVSLQTHTVLPVNKYSLSFRIINTVLVKSSSLKDETECIWAYVKYKTHRIALLEDIPSLFVYVVFFLFFLASALRPKVWSGRGVGEVQAVICLRP